MTGTFETPQLLSPNNLLTTTSLSSSRPRMSETSATELVIGRLSFSLRLTVRLYMSFILAIPSRRSFSSFILTPTSWRSTTGLKQQTRLKRMELTFCLIGAFTSGFCSFERRVLVNHSSSTSSASYETSFSCSNQSFTASSFTCFSSASLSTA
ncbi:hypothetical protein FRX31_031385 [Thalictrum thalictroides]|uniref:Uncharacterized protein n=1 Tax=Thalictrum thalictroides TaxID=46969 RepID=A0A7J6V2W3_THATH|nr:hypothetical protein FRX31_031385 [Thalictrum thalictroides]